MIRGPRRVAGSVATETRGDLCMEIVGAAEALGKVGESTW